MELDIKKCWGENCFFSNGSSNARGVIIIIPKNIDFIMEKVETDTDGRYIILSGIFNTKKMTVVNFYAPTQDKPEQQIKVLEDLFSKMYNKCHETVWCGDFNSYMSPMQDKYNAVCDKDTPMVARLKAIIEDHDLCDIWRVLNPDKLRYTWRNNTGKGIAQSRLDYFIVPNSCLYDVLECSINPAFMSDHNIISLHVSIPKAQRRGRGTWKFNNSLLRDAEFVKKMNQGLDESIDNHKNVKDKRLKWDVIKMDIRGSCISYCSYKNKKERQYEKELIIENKALEENMCKNPNENTRQILKTNNNELAQIAHERSQGAQLRANCLHIENNEQNSSYFFSKEKSRAEAKAMTTLIDDNGTVFHNLCDISNEQKVFYENLYQEPQNETVKDIQEATQYFLDKTKIKTIDDIDRNALDNVITLNEISLALNDLPNNKTPGCDGLDASFYKFFWSKIGNTVSDSIMQGVQEGELSIEQKRAILTLLPKKDKDTRYIKNWRPLSLLNTDYKILAKLLAKRLQVALPELISTDQSGCIKKRSTHSNIRSILDIIDHAKSNNNPGIIAFIDFEKAFDTVKWSFLYKTLEKMNFGNFYIKCIKTLYNDISTYVSNCGSLSTPFKPTRGIRQGCPISANLFVIIVETLANAIRQNDNITGYKIGNIEFKINQYADDTCIYVKDVQSLKNVFSVLNLFTKCAGLKANKDKSDALGIGSSSNYRHRDIGIKWPSGSIRCLGVLINIDLEKTYEENFKERLEKINKLMQQWCLRKLTIKGKILIVNSLLMPQLLYICTVLGTPKWVINRFNNMVKKIVWSDKPAKVKYACLINSIENGGLKLQDLACKSKALKIKWLNDMCNRDLTCVWKSAIKDKIKTEPHEALLTKRVWHEEYTFNDPFYTEVFQVWHELHNFNPTNGHYVCNELISNNAMLKIAGKVINKKQWKFQEMTHIQHLLNDNGEFATVKYLNDKYAVKIPILSHNSVLSAIPKEWKKIIKEDGNVNNYVIFNDYFVMIEDVRKKLQELTTKEVYWHLLKKICKRPTSENSWEEETGLNFDEKEWESIYTNVLKTTRDTKLISFHFKITHRILACKRNLYRWKIKLDNICDLCQNEIDSIEHHLLACPQILPFWDSFFHWWKTTMKMSFPVDTYEVIFGIPNPNNDVTIMQLNYMLLQATYYIYVGRQRSAKADLYEYLMICKKELRICQINLTAKGQEAKYASIWEPLFDVI